MAAGGGVGVREIGLSVSVLQSAVVAKPPRANPSNYHTYDSRNRRGSIISWLASGILAADFRRDKRHRFRYLFNWRSSDIESAEAGRIKMGQAQLTIFIEQFAVAVLVSIVWLVTCKAIRSLRRKPGRSYSIASALVLSTCLALPNGLAPAGLVAGIIVLAILYIFYKRALRKQSFDAATIISYENHDII
jgi:hypothetical protein